MSQLKRQPKKDVEPRGIGITPRDKPALPQRRAAPIFDWIGRWVREPQSIERLTIVRVLAPLAVLGFMSGRAAHADEWLGENGFRVPDHAGDWRQPLYLPGLPDSMAWGLAGLLIASGLSLAIGFRARLSALVFAFTLIYVALADRLAAFTVSKIAPAIALALAASPCGARYAVDVWQRARKRSPRATSPYRRTREEDPLLPTQCTGGSVRFFQAFLAVFYCASGVCKARGDWLKNGIVLYTHMHDSYQTAFSFALARVVPSFVWTLLQGVVLVFELFAPLWFAMKRTRNVALVVAVGMHMMIGLMFGPVRWFSMLMISLLLGAYLPEEIIDKLASFSLRRRATANP